MHKWYAHKSIEFAMLIFIFCGGEKKKGFAHSAIQIYGWLTQTRIGNTNNCLPSHQKIQPLKFNRFWGVLASFELKRKNEKNDRGRELNWIGMAFQKWYQKFGLANCRMTVWKGQKYANCDFEVFFSLHSFSFIPGRFL